MKAISKEAIPNLKYEGWYWLSDEAAPQVLTNDDFSGDALQQDNSFVVEAQLWNEQEGTNISIRFADGRHYIAQYNLNEIPDDMKSKERRLLGHRLDGRDLRVIDLWQEQELKTGDDETMITLVPMCSVFVGFK